MQNLKTLEGLGTVIANFDNVCDTEKGGAISVHALEKAATSKHNTIPFEFSDWEIAEGKKDTMGEVRKVEGDMEKSTEIETEKSHEILQKNTENSRDEGYILKQAPEGDSSLGSRESKEEKKKGNQHEEGD